MTRLDRLARALSDQPQVHTAERAEDDWTASTCGCLAHGRTEAEARAALEAMLANAARIEAEQAERDAERMLTRAANRRQRAKMLRGLL